MGLEGWESFVIAEGDEVGVSLGLVSDEALGHGLGENPRPKVQTQGRLWGAHW